MKYYLTDIIQSILIRKRLSKTFPLSNGVPQDPCIGPIAFFVYISALFNLTEKHNKQIDEYVDDNQLRTTCKPTIYSLKENIKLQY